MNELSVLGIHLAEAVAATSDVAMLPVGEWKTDKYGKVDLSESVCDEIIANFADNVLGRDIRVDIDHGFAEAAGWIAALGYGVFTDPKTKQPQRAVCMRVDWTPTGETALSNKEYRYVSAAYGSYTDVESGKTYANVLRAVSLTNDPVLRVPAVDQAPSSVEFAGVALSESLQFGEVVDELHKQQESQTPPELQAASWGMWPATDAFVTKVREAVADGMTGEELKARIDELAADLPDALMESIAASVERENEGGPPSVTEPIEQVDPTQGAAELSDTGAEDPVTALLSRFDALMGECDDIVKGTAGVKSMRTLASETRKKLEALLTKKGGTTSMAEDTKLAEERDDALTKLAEMQAERKRDRVKAALDTLSAKGLAEPARVQLEAILTAEDTSQIMLSGKTDPVDLPDALVAFAETVEFVPVEKPEGDPQKAADTVTLSDAEIQSGKDMGVSEEYLLKAKIARQAAEAADEAEED
jgi:hypothetical protein